jgi:hypothetical protein
LLLIILLALLLVFGFGGYGYRDRYGTWGFSPVALIVIILLFAWFAGAFN